MKVRQLGGYTPEQIQCHHESGADESKIFVFVTNPETNLDECLHFSHYHYVNIYKAYFESCQYAFILEFYVANIHTEEFMEQMKAKNRHFELGLYKECMLQDV